MLYLTQDNCEQPDENDWGEMAGSLMYRPAAGGFGGAGSSFLRFPVVRPAWRGAGANGVTWHNAVPDLLDGSVGRVFGVVHYVFLRFPSSPARLAAANTSPGFSSVLPVVCTPPSHFLMFFLPRLSLFRKSSPGLSERPEWRLTDGLPALVAFSLKSLAAEQVVSRFGICIVLKTLQDASPFMGMCPSDSIILM